MNDSSTYKNFFEKYSSLVKENIIETAFEYQEKVLDDFFTKITEDKSNYAYAEGKWTLKEMLQHIIDTERIFAYRALAISRKETASLPSFDENLYANNSDANRRTWAELVEEMKAVRKATTLLFRSFNAEMLDTVGAFSGTNQATVKLIGFITIGHAYHHIKITTERYL